MPKLSSSIVTREIASLRDVEEALARQVLYGGDLVTNLLEQSPGVEESALTTLLAESLELQPGPSGELPKAEAEALRMVPADVALRHGLYPIRNADGTLAIVVSEKLSAEVEQDLGFALGVKIEQRGAPLVRIRQAISRDYGLPLDRRSQRVVAKLEGKPDPSPSIAPAPLQDAPDISALPRPPSVPPIGLPETGDAPLYAAGDHTPSIHDAVSKPAPTVAVGNQEPAAPNEIARSSGTLSGMPAVNPGAGAAPADAPPRKASGQYLAAWGAAQTKQARRRGSRRSRHRGPYTAADAEEDLLSAAGRDDVLGAFFDFAAQYFEYSALFAVHGDIAEGRDAHGPGASRSEIAGIGVPLDLPSSLARARDELRFSLVRLSKDGLDAQLAKDLHREIGRKVLLLPVELRGRCVLIFYGDDGATDVQLGDVGDVISLAPLVSSALENVILQMKRAARKGVEAPASQPPSAAPPSSRPPPRSQLPHADERAEALLSSLHESIRPEEPRSATPPQGTPKTASKPPPPRTSTPPGGAKATQGMVPATEIEPKPEPPAAEAKLPAPPATGEPTGPVFSLTRRSFTPASVPPEEEPPGDGWDIPSRPGDEKPNTAKLSDVVTTPPKARVKDDDAPQISIGAADAPTDWPSADEDEDDPLPESRSEVVAPMHPRKSHKSEELGLPTVIVDTETDARKVVDRFMKGDEGALDEIVRLGNHAITVLAAAFPGPVSTTPGPKARASECGPVLRALSRVGAAAAPFVVVRTNDADPKIRAWATRLLGELPGPESAAAIVRRLADDDSEARRAARDAGHLLQSDDASRGALRDGACTMAADTKQEAPARVTAIEALTDWRDARAIPRLAKLVSDGDEVGKSAHWALVTLSRQDFGRETADWETWWQKNHDRHRIEWLIDSLMHDDADVRRAAGDEIKALTKEYFGFYDDLPAKERSLAQRRYREWWEATGKARFAR